MAFAAGLGVKQEARAQSDLVPLFCVLMMNDE